MFGQQKFNLWKQNMASVCKLTLVVKKTVGFVKV